MKLKDELKTRWKSVKDYTDWLYNGFDERDLGELYDKTAILVRKFPEVKNKTNLLLPSTYEKNGETTLSMYMLVGTLQIGSLAFTQPNDTNTEEFKNNLESVWNHYPVCLVKAYGNVQLSEDIFIVPRENILMYWEDSCLDCLFKKE